MKMPAATVALAMLLVCAVQAEETNPIAKVIEMISDLEAKIIGEGENAHKIYAEFAEQCDDRSKQLEFEIKTGKGQVAELTATIDDKNSEIGSLTEKIDELSASIATNEKNLAKETDIRNKEAKDFAAEEAELVETKDMMERAISIIEKEMKGGASMLQLQSASNLAQALTVLVEAASFSSKDAQKLTAFVQRSSDDDAGAPDAAVYESHSGSIVETLQGLLDKCDAQLDEARKAETTSLHNFDLLKQSLLDEIKYANKDMDEAKQNREAATADKATAEGDLAQTQKDLDNDVAELAKLHRDCMKAASEYEEETTSRGEELAALGKAKQIITEATSGEGGAAAQTYSFLQLGTASSNVIRFVKDLARKEHSSLLAQLASRLQSAVRISSGDDVFAKVKGLIEDMLAKLQQEAAEDATKKAHCDKEMSETTAKQEEKQAEVDKLSSKIEQKSAESAKLKDEVSVLQKELAELAKAQAEGEKLRGEQLDAFNADKPELEKGLDGIKRALTVLREYYAKEDKDHEAAEGASNSIIGLLEVAESDVSKGLAEMVATENARAAAFEQQTKDNAITKVTKEKDVEYKTKASKGLDKAVSDHTKDLDAVQQELAAVNQYMDSLKEECVAVAETYAERKQRREAELAGLKEALQILEAQSFVQKDTVRRTLRGIKRS